MPYETQPGTMPHRVVQLLKTLPPGETITTAVICERLGLEDHQVGSFSAWMAPARKAGAVKAEAREGMGRTLYWSIGEGAPEPGPQNDMVQRIVRVENAPPVAPKPASVLQPPQEPRLQPKPAPAPPPPEPDEESQPDEPEDASEFDAWLSARTGGIVLTGVVLDDQGSLTLQPEQVQLLRKLLEAAA